MSDTTAIICSRANDPACYVTGAKVLHCHECREEVWVSPATIRTAKKKTGSLDGVRLVCLQCYPELTRKYGTDIEPLSEDQREELRREFEKEKNHGQ